MPTYRLPARGRARGLSLLGTLVLMAACAFPAAAQQRKYLVELGAGGMFQSFDDITELGSGKGGLLRLGLWLPAHFSVEAEGSLLSSKADIGGSDVSVKTLTLAALYNIPIGTASSGYLKVGGGGTEYGSDCPGPTEPTPPYPCGGSGALVVGAGARVAVSPTVMIRGEGLLNRNSSKSRSFSNFGFNLGLSFMLGSKPIDDSDGDGILNNRDRCPDTPAGAQVDGRGCPSDTDSDGVANGVDKCPTTVAGATVDSTGCAVDSDGDNIADGLDRCPDTPEGVLVDPRGCPRDSDGDAIADGLDRCSDTPRGATVDALGCPGDEDGDGVLDGLDRCPRTSVGAKVNASGCAAGQSPNAPAPAPTQAPPAQGPPPQAQPAQGQPPAAAAAVPPAVTRDTAAPKQNKAAGKVTAGVLPGVGFETGSARLSSSSYVALDSLVRILLADPSQRIEILAHTDNSGTAAATLHLTSLQSDAVRNYLVTKGVPFQQVVARGLGAPVPLTPDTTPRGRAANRRVEVRPILAGQ
jgi:outer membrane protein OmpA-like peptidoglycan-associated protein